MNPRDGLRHRTSPWPLAALDFHQSARFSRRIGWLRDHVAPCDDEAGRRKAGRQAGRLILFSVHRRVTLLQNPDDILLFAAGNDGHPDSHGECSVITPATGKNVIAVGSSTSGPSRFSSAPTIDQVSDFSGRGPLPDGRIKPDVSSYYRYAIARWNLTPSPRW